MKMNVPDNIQHIVILNIEGIYAQIHNDGYFSKVQINQIKEIYSDKTKYRVIEIN